VFMPTTYISNSTKRMRFLLIEKIKRKEVVIRSNSKHVPSLFFSIISKFGALEKSQAACVFRAIIML